MPRQELGDLRGLDFTSKTSYTIVDEIGRGGMGIVFLAIRENEDVRDYVALKTIRTRSRDIELRLKNEANIATGLRHENIVKTYGIETISYGDLPVEFLKEIDSLSYEQAKRQQVAKKASKLDAFAAHRKKKPLIKRTEGDIKHKKMYMIVMDYVEGTDIRTLQAQHLEKKLLIPVSLAAFMVVRVCRALQYAHEFIVHRDLSPENILLNLQGVVKVSDFGVAATHGDEEISGKLSYMAPEQFQKQPADKKSDIYSLGLVLYETLTGLHPRRTNLGADPKEEFRRLRELSQTPVTPPDDICTDIPKELSDVCVRMLAPEAKKRNFSMGDIGTVLEQKYLYAAGFGPTNNSLSAYLALFNQDFKDPTQTKIRQLKFLADNDMKVHLKRTIDANRYTELGRKLLAGG